MIEVEHSAEARPADNLALRAGVVRRAGLPLWKQSPGSAAGQARSRFERHCHVPPPTVRLSDDEDYVNSAPIPGRMPRQGWYRGAIYPILRKSYTSHRPAGQWLPSRPEARHYVPADRSLAPIPRVLDGRAQLIAQTPGRACWSRLCLVLPTAPCAPSANACTGFAVLAGGDGGEPRPARGTDGSST
jgi:hypothetical protein